MSHESKNMGRRVVRKNKYDMSLHDRLIIENFAYEHPIVSYGLILYCTSTQRYIIVQRGRTPHFKAIILGSFRHSTLILLLSGITREEFSLCKKLHEKEEFVRVYKQICYHDQDDIDDAYSRFLNEVVPMMQEISENDLPTETEWLWPKGKLNRPREDPVHGAKREFKEETGIEINENMKLLNNDSIVEKYTGHDGKRYETYYWRYSVDKEISIDLSKCQGISTGEIRNVKWESFEGLQEKLQPFRLNILLNLKKSKPKRKGVLSRLPIVWKEFGADGSAEEQKD